jgi:ribonuclease P/MRP protein subunit RPP1
MKRAFADLHLRVNPREESAFKTLMQKAAKKGYHYVSGTLNVDVDQDTIKKAKLFCENLGLDFILRADIRPRTENDLTRTLRQIRRKFEVICVICDNKEIARQAAKDRRVDLLNFPGLDYRKRFFDRQEAELASNSLACLEIDVKPLLVLDGPARVRFLSALRREVAIAQEFHIPIVFSSGVSEAFLMRMPKDMASLGYLMGLHESVVLDTVSTNPEAIIKRNREKLGSKFVAPGIKIVREGKDP